MLHPDELFQWVESLFHRFILSESPHHLDQFLSANNIADVISFSFRNLKISHNDHILGDQFSILDGGLTECSGG